MSNCLAVALACALAAPLDAANSQVFLFRHCLRSTGSWAKNAKPEFPRLDQYTSHPLPHWGVPEYWCTEGGLEAARAAGKALVANFGVDPLRMSMSADISMRDSDTAVAFLTGMEARAAVYYDAQLYAPLAPEAGRAACEEPDAARTLAGIHERFAAVPLPWDLDTAIDEFEKVFGVGVAGSLRDLGPIRITEMGKMSGPVQVMKELAQTLLYSRASGINYLGHATMQQVQRLYAWAAYYRSVVDVTADRAFDSCWLLALTLRDLFDKKGHSSLNFGHDSNQDGFAALLDLEWEAPPYLGGRLIPKPPMGAIRLVHDAEKDTVNASFVYVAFNGDPAAADFSESAIKSWTRDGFIHAAHAGLQRFGASECFSKSPYQSQEHVDFTSKPVKLKRPGWAP